MKKKAESEEGSNLPQKKIKLDAKKKSTTKDEVIVKNRKKEASTDNKPLKYSKNLKKGDPTNLKEAKVKSFAKKGNLNQHRQTEKTNFAELKKQKKELRIKRIQTKLKDNFSVIQMAKKMSEELRRKTLKEEKRNDVINKLHLLLKGKDHYAKFVVAHDTARIVQWLLKYSSEAVIREISQELIPVTVNMLQSKYGIHCVKRLLKYGQNNIRTSVIDSMMGNAVKLASHAISAPVVDYAFSNWASPLQKQYLIQEFYGDLYKNSKDKDVKHIRDTYKDDESLKVATLRATKSNIQRILNKSLLDSGLVQSVICQYLQECSSEDRTELISLLAPHVVVISNSRDGARAAMQCMWYGSNKDRKIIMKALKEHLLELSKHEHGHCTIITLLDCADDTVLLHKIILSEILKNARDLAVTEWGRKVLVWLVAPGDPTLFHPVFIKELTSGRESSTCKKSLEIRRQEILTYSISSLLDLIVNDTGFWLSNGSLAIEMLAIIKAGSGENLEKALNSIVKLITDINWTIKENDKDIFGIESAGIHMILKKLAQHDKVSLEKNNPTFGNCLIQHINDDTTTTWLKTNRGCFLLVAVFENGSEDIQNNMKQILKKCTKLLKKESSAGAKILLSKIK